MNKLKSQQTKFGTTTTNLVRGFKLETPRLNNQNANIKPQDDWRHHEDSINKKLKQLTTEPDTTTWTTETLRYISPQGSSQIF